MTKKWVCAALTHPAFCGVSRAHLGDVIAELADLWLARRESELRERRGAERQREAGAGPKHDLVFIDGLTVTLVFIDGLPAPWSRRKPSTGLVPARQAAC